MELTCKQCSAKFRPKIDLPLLQAVRVACPSCGKQMVLRPPTLAVPVGVAPATEATPQRRAVIADEPRLFRKFLGAELGKMGFEVEFFEAGEEALKRVRATRADLVILNVYLKGKLGVEISEEIKADSTLERTRVVLIGALFRANRFRANPTNLYGADEYIEEQIPAKELRQIVKKLFPDLSSGVEHDLEPREYDDARRLARLILSDIIINHGEKVERGIRENTFFEQLKNEIEEGRKYYDSRIPFKVRQKTEFFNETLQQFVQMKREEIDRNRSSAGSA